MPWIKSEQELREALKVLDEFAYDIIKERRQDPNIADKTGTHTDHRATLVCVVLTAELDHAHRSALTLCHHDRRQRRALHGQIPA
jgi:glutamate/tyrosine decarboxylase-like PLP-dependent enzyme